MEGEKGGRRVIGEARASGTMRKSRIWQKSGEERRTGQDDEGKEEQWETKIVDRHFFLSCLI